MNINQQELKQKRNKDSRWKNSILKLPESIAKNSNAPHSEKQSCEYSDNDVGRSNIHIEEESEDIYESIDTFDQESYKNQQQRLNTDTDDVSNDTEEISTKEQHHLNDGNRRVVREIEVDGRFGKNKANNKIPESAKGREPGGMFEELENIVQNLGNSAKNKQTESQCKDTETEENPVEFAKSYHTNFTQNSNDYQSLLNKCEYLESLNQNLVSENAKLKMQLENESSKSKQYQIELRSSYDNMSKSQKNHLSQIK